jgi:hypothetical protein|tara:strand:+ start:227 stop:424 length:198 start_codon:yes stop_codon:yes gene_type:complete
MEDERIRIRKGVSGNSLLITRHDGKGGCTLFMPVSEDRAIEFVKQNLRIQLNSNERQMICARINS